MQRKLQLKSNGSWDRYFFGKKNKWVIDNVDRRWERAGRIPDHFCNSSLHMDVSPCGFESLRYFVCVCILF